MTFNHNNFKQLGFDNEFEFIKGCWSLSAIGWHGKAWFNMEPCSSTWEMKKNCYIKKKSLNHTPFNMASLKRIKQNYLQR
jgi:hypothetical protein